MQINKSPRPPPQSPLAGLKVRCHAHLPNSVTPTNPQANVPRFCTQPHLVPTSPPPVSPRDANAETLLCTLFAVATAAAEQEHASLARSAAWQTLKQVLVLLSQAQNLLLEPEVARCAQLQQRRKRPCSVRFACYDLSSLDHPSSRSAGSQQLQLFEVLLKLRASQLRLLQQPPAAARRQACDALCAALRKQAHAPPSWRGGAAATAAAAHYYADGFERLVRDRELMMAERLAEVLCSLGARLPPLCAHAVTPPCPRDPCLLSRSNA